MFGSSKESEHKYDVELNPLPENKQLSVFGPEYVSDQLVALHLKTKWSFSGDTLSVTDPSGETWFSIKGDAVSLKDTKVVFGKDEKPLFVIADKKWWNPFNDDQCVFDCRGIGDDLQGARDVNKDKSKLMFSVVSNFGNTKQTTQVRNQGAKGDLPEMVDIVSKCTFFNGKCAIWRDGDQNTGGTPLAKFMSPLELQNFIGKSAFGGAPTEDFYLTVAPGADIAFCLAQVLAVREMNENY